MSVRLLATFAVFASCAFSASAFADSPATAPFIPPPTTQNALAIPVEQQPFDSSQYLIGIQAGSHFPLRSGGPIPWTGVLPERPIDELGLGAAYAHFSNRARTRDDFELAIKTFYRIRFTQFVSLKPDLQYIIHPSGSGEIGAADRDNALVASLRFEVSL